MRVAVGWTPRQYGIPASGMRLSGCVGSPCARPDSRGGCPYADTPSQGDHSSETIGVMDGVRMDAWLWAARFFKTRTLAKKACDLGRARSNEQLAKAAREVRIGDMLRIITEGGEFEVKVLGVSDVRGPASEAQKLYLETDASKEMRAKAAAERRAAREFEILPEGRPSKRDRRRIIQFRGRG